MTPSDHFARWPQLAEALAQTLADEPDSAREIADAMNECIDDLEALAQRRERNKEKGATNGHDPDH